MVSPSTKRRVETERHMQQHGIPRCKACEDLNTTSGMHWAWEQQKMQCFKSRRQHQGKMYSCGKDSCLIAHTHKLLQLIFKIHKQDLESILRTAAMPIARGI
jgi:hypothetical protein